MPSREKKRSLNYPAVLGPPESHHRMEEAASGTCFRRILEGQGNGTRSRYQGAPRQDRLISRWKTIFYQERSGASAIRAQRNDRQRGPFARDDTVQDTRSLPVRHLLYTYPWASKRSTGNPDSVNPIRDIRSIPIFSKGSTSHVPTTSGVRT